MADRRRRKCTLNDNSDCGSDESGDEQQINNSSEQGSDGGNSEYESVDEEELQEAALDEGESELAVIAADGTEESKSLDHDEDRKNPQYIPKKGTFYEHDDRTMGEGEENIVDNVSEKSAPVEKETKKKVWKEDGKWQHDRYSVYDQSPKSREELVATYGYDIRNEEGPPRARRRRRYGRGPNKYTRNWEDMDAYSKPTRGRPDVRRGRGRGRKIDGVEEEEEFPALSSTTNLRDDKDQEANEDELHKQLPIPTTQAESLKVMNSAAIVESYDDLPRNKNVSLGGQNIRGGFVEDHKREIGGQGRGNRPNRRAKPGLKGSPRNYGYSDGGQFNMGRNRGDRGRGEGKLRTSGRGGHTQSPVSHMTSNYPAKEIQEITDELKAVTISASQKEEHHYKKRNVDTRRSTIPPRLQETMRGGNVVSHGGDANSVSKPKRYSSQRQRTLPDQMGQFHHPQGYYDQNSSDAGFNSKIYERTNSSPGTITPAQLSLSGQAPPTFVAPSFTTTANTFPPGPRLFPSGTPQPHLIGAPIAVSSIGGPPPVAGPGVTGPPVPGTVGGPPVTGPPFLPPENMLNYAAGAPGLVAAPHPPQFPAFQAFTPVSQQQPQEIYSNGVMYYNTQSQQHLPRMNPVLQKRPKAAIPIIPPPERQRATEEQDDNDYEGIRDTYETYDDQPQLPQVSSEYIANKVEEGYHSNSSESTQDIQEYREASVTDENTESLAISEEPETLDEPEEPETLDEPEEPETLDEPEEPETLDEPEEPETLDEPEEPETLDEPEEPETLNEPEEPETLYEPTKESVLHTSSVIEYPDAEIEESRTKEMADCKSIPEEDVEENTTEESTVHSSLNGEQEIKTSETDLEDLNETPSVAKHSEDISLLDKTDKTLPKSEIEDSKEITISQVDTT